MSKRHTLKKTAALLLGIALTVGGTGCNFLTTDNQKDLAQTVATVNIAENLKNDETYKDYADAVAELVNNGGLSTDIYKRDLIAYFLSVGATYVQSYGYTYKDTFNMLMDTLVRRKIMMQYAVAYYLAKGDGVTAEGCEAYVKAETEKAQGREKELLEKYPEVLTYKYFLTKGGNAEEMDDYNLSVYSLLQSLNSSLDSLEESVIVAEEEEHDHGTARTTPTGVATEKEDFYPVDADGNLNYGVYTGRNALDACGEYEKVEGSTTVTRRKAYNSFLASLQSYGLIQDNENTAEVTQLDYFYTELASSLGVALINKYYEDLQDEVIQGISDAYVEQKYNEIYEAQKYSYEDVSAFETAIGSLSDDSFVLYGARDFGFVYNILIPFSATQEQAYSAAKNKGLTQEDLYEEREAILANIQAKDLRDSWISAHDHANYSYVKDGKYYFFEDNFTNPDRYESLTQYAGNYAYNGTVDTSDEHNYKFTPNKMDIDGFIAEMNGYITEVSGCEVSGKKATTYGSSYVNADESVNYGNFVYYSGKVQGLEGETNANYFNPESTQYKVVSAVNEIMFAYSTDTGCLNTYMGYAVSPYKTSFVSEFEYAAQEAVKGGVGSIVVCATDYGWHIIYCSFVYDAPEGENGGDVYGGYKAADKDVEGTFSNLFYESLKATSASNHASEVESSVLNKYNNDTSVTLYTSRYQDLLDMDNA